MFYIYAGNELIYQAGNDNYKLASPKLTVEFGKAGSLEFAIPSTNPAYNSLNQLKTIVTVLQDNKEIFRGRVLSNKLNFYNTRDVYAEGDLAYLVDSVQKAEKYSGKAKALFSKIIAAHNKMVGDATKQFTVGTVNIEDRDVYLAGKSEDIKDKDSTHFNYKQIALNSIAEEWQTTYDYIDECLIKYCGGYLRTRRANGKTYIDWIKDYASEATQTIEVGRNVIDLSTEVNVEDLFTVLIPLGDENLTVEKAAAYNKDGITHTAGSAEIINTAGVQKYGRILKTNVFDSVTSPATLLENGVRFLKTNSDFSETFTITAIDLHLIDPNIQAINLGDRAQIISTPHSINTTLTCTKIEYDLAQPANTVYTFGKPKQTLTERYRKDQNAQADTASRGGGGGGGGAASAAAEDAENAADKNVKKIFDAWVRVDKDKATVDIGALYRELHGENKIINDVGMLMNGQSATVDLYADHTQTVQNGKDIGTLGDNITTITNKTGIKLDGSQGAIDIFADHDETVQNGKDIATISNKTGIKLDSSQAAIDIFADHNKTVENGKDITTICNSTGIKLDGTAGTVNIFSTAKDVKTNQEYIASIKTWAGYDETTKKFGSNIALQADLVTIDAKITNITGALTVGKTLNVNRYVEAPGVYAGKLLIGASGAYYDSSMHTHTFTVDDGKVTIGGADWTGADHFFNIADTQYYKDGVSAAKQEGASSVYIVTAKTVWKNTSGTVIGVKITLSNGAAPIMYVSTSV